jgi:DNA-binding MarR family transcriptional regulator
MPESKPGNPADVADRVHSAAIHLLRGLRKQDAKSGITAARLSALSVVVFGGPTTIGRLATAEQVSAPTMTRLVTSMEAAGLVVRHRDPEDRSVVWIKPTRKGSSALQKARRRRVAALEKRIASLDAADLHALAKGVALLERIAAP